MKGLRSRGMLPLASAVAVAFTGLGASPALANASLLESLMNTPTSTSACVAPYVSQPFLSVNDTNLYALLPGETPDNFAGAGWTLVDGARIVSATLADGQTGSVLDLPSGSVAISPPICITSSYPTARTEVQNVRGAEGVFFNVSYAQANGWSAPRNTGQVHGRLSNWTLSDPINIQPSNAPGWQLVRFGFLPGGSHSDFRIYNFFVDPRMTR
jgi:hypothetical protein